LNNSKIIHVPLAMISGSLNLLEASGPVQALQTLQRSQQIAFPEARTRVSKTCWCPSVSKASGNIWREWRYSCKPA